MKFDFFFIIGVWIIHIVVVSIADIVAVQYKQVSVKRVCFSSLYACMFIRDRGLLLLTLGGRIPVIHYIRYTYTITYIILYTL